MDILDIYNGRYYNTYLGTYYKKLPSPTLYTSIEDLYNLETGIFIDYEILDPASREYRTIISNLIDTDTMNVAIKTRDIEDYRAGEFIVLEDGNLYKILSVTEDTSAASREAARLFPVPLGTEYILRLLEIENPRGVT